MAKNSDDSGETVVKGSKPPATPPPKPELRKPAKPPRGFPFKLWFWAILMTVAAGAGGYFTYQFRDQAKTARADLKDVSDKLASSDSTEAATKQALDACTSDRDRAQGDGKACETQLEQATHNLGATKEQLDAVIAQAKVTKDRADAIESIRKKLEDMIKTGDLKVTSRRGSLVVELPSEVLFASGSSDLSRPGEVTVIQVAGVLKEFGDRRFLVVGHTDNLPLKGSTYKDNLELSVERSLTVVRYLIEGGMKPQNVIPGGAGDSDPIVDNSSAQGRARNRRIEIQLLPALAELPPLPSGLDDSSAAAPTPAPAAPAPTK